jgi:hypothetical protein
MRRYSNGKKTLGANDREIKKDQNLLARSPEINYLVNTL